jgi:hypothetical protein
MRTCAILVLAALASCGGGGGSSATPAAPLAASTSAGSVAAPGVTVTAAPGTTPTASATGSTGTIPTSIPTAITGAATVTVNFASARKQVSMSGFLNGQVTLHAVPSALLTPLAPAVWRGSTSNDPGDEANLHALFPAMTYVDVLSDDYGYPFQGTWSSTGAKAAPFDLAPYAGGSTAWAARVTTSVAALCAHPEVVYEEWNEPDVSGASDFFYGTEPQADAAQAGAYAATVKTCPGALSGAPATVLYDKTFINDYLTYCTTHGCNVNFISMHDSVDSDIPKVATDLEDARTTLLQSSAFAGLHIAKIYDDEIVGPTANREPGDVVAYLYYLEAGGADGAAKACWTSPTGANECFDGSVDGIIDPATKEPRAVWWSYKYYADGVASRVATSTVDPGIVAIASSASATAGAAQVLLGAIDVNGAGPSTSTPIVKLQGVSSVAALAGAATVTVRATTIAASDTTPVPTLPAATVQTVPVVGGSASVAVTLAPHTAVVLTISPK